MPNKEKRAECQMNITAYLTMTSEYTHRTAWKVGYTSPYIPVGKTLLKPIKGLSLFLKVDP